MGKVETKLTEHLDMQKIPYGLLITGSRATGNSSENSDYDFILIVDKDKLEVLKKTFDFVRGTESVINEVLENKADIGALKFDFEGGLISIHIITKEILELMANPHYLKLKSTRNTPYRDGDYLVTDLKSNKRRPGIALKGGKKVELPYLLVKKSTVEVGYVDHIVKSKIVKDTIGIKRRINHIFLGYVRSVLYHQQHMTYNRGTGRLEIEKHVTPEIVMKTIQDHEKWPSATKKEMGEKIGDAITSLRKQDYRKRRY